MMVWDSRQTEAEEIVESLKLQGVLAAGYYLRTEKGLRTQQKDY
ncbi:MAG: hypothetical protein PUP92_21385 [Rhizonema sp. PD38]|nr:hypothetical protein [Rhizonema sp. PD38]